MRDHQFARAVYATWTSDLRICAESTNGRLDTIAYEPGVAWAITGYVAH
jgi:hypothetical protein